jgi:hypothetical protein
MNITTNSSASSWYVFSHVSAVFEDRTRLQKKRNLVQIEDPEEPPKKRKSSAKPRELKNASGA